MTELDQELVEKLSFAYAKDPVLAARQLFPHWFPRPMPWFHRGMLAVLLRRSDFLLNFGEEVWADGTCRWTKKKLAKLARCMTFKLNPKDPKSPEVPIFHIKYKEDGRTPHSVDMVLGTHVVFIIPRGFSKTTIINFCTIYKVVYGMTKFTVYISEAARHAEDQLATIKRELAGNERLIAIFGNLKPNKTDDQSWGAESFETLTGVKITAKGRNAQIRGLNKFADRPDTIVLDDVEDRDSVSTDANLQKTLSWFVADVMEALPRGRNGCIYAIGTLLNPKALLPVLSSDPDFTTILLGAIDKDGEALWDDKAGLTLEAIEKKKQSAAAKGKLYEFGLEILSSVREGDKLMFKPEYIRYRTYQPKDFIARSIHIDPAIGKGSDACHTAIAVVGLMESGHKHVCDFLSRPGMSMNEQADEYFKMKIRWDCTHASVESVAYQAALAQVLRELMFIKAKQGLGIKAYFEIRETWPQGRKIERVEGILQPLMASGYLTFQQIWPELEIMFSDWPKGLMDGPDVIAGAVANLEPFAALSYGNAEELEKSEPFEPFEAPCAIGSGVIP